MVKFSCIFLFLNYSSSSKGPKKGCFKEENRKIAVRVANVKGTITTDKSKESSLIGLLFPCNLADEFKVEETKVVFSGYVYESFDPEEICADYFEITLINFIDL